LGLPYTTTTAAKLTAAQMNSAGALTFVPYVSETPNSTFTQLAEVFGTNSVTGHTLYKINLSAGAIYNFLSGTFNDPRELTLYDQFGNVLGVNDEANDGNGVVIGNAAVSVDVIYGWQAPYTGTYYIEAGWIQGGATQFYVLDVLGDVSPLKTLHAPTAKTPPTSIEWTEGKVFSYTLPTTAFTDQDANSTLTYYAVQKDGSELPSWMSLDAKTGVLSGVAPANTADLGIVLFAKDNTDLSSSGTAITITTPSGAGADVTVLNTLTAAYTNILRFEPSANDASFKMLVDQVVKGTTPLKGAINTFLYMADATTSVATLSYQFFTGKIPGGPGYDYLVSPTGPNANNLNSAYYQNFNLENRYINFAVNLGKTGEGKAVFEQGYGPLTLFEATREAYKTIFGRAPSDDKIHALIDARVDYFASYGGDGPNGLGTKAAMAGWLLAEAVKADIGMYALSNDNFLVDLADGANYAVNLVGVYGKADYAYGG